jgi:nicotinamidase-related amidase
MRGYRVVVPEDCVAARQPDDRRRALALMRRALDADTRPVEAIDVKALRGGPDRRRR